MSNEPGTKTERDDLAPTEVNGPGAPDTVAEVPSLGVIGRFRIEAALGSGGMADVYRAYDPMLDRDVALKVLRTKRSADGPQRMRRVLREARAAAALTHPNTVTIFDVGEADGEVFIAMELLQGDVLKASLGRADVSLDQKLRWLVQAARALAAAHERGLVHRDVKPDNMFVCADGTLKLLDFGIAKRDEDDSLGGESDSIGPSSMRTAEGRLVGTPRYMAPEQRAGQATDARTDEYAWGLVAFELLTGSHPVAAMPTTDEVEVASTVTTARLAELREKVPELPEAIASTITRALEPRKEDRFPSMTPIVDALERRAELVPSLPPKAVSQAPPPHGGRSRWWIAAGVLALAAIAGAVTVRVVSRSRETAAAAASAATTLPACRVESTRSTLVAADDRVAVLPNGAIVVARNIKRGLVLERETPTGSVPFSTGPHLAAIGTNYTDVVLHGIRYQGEPALALELFQDGLRGSLLVVATEDGRSTNMYRVSGPVTGLAVAGFREDLIAVTTMAAIDNRPGDLPGGAEAHLMTPRGPQRHTVEVGESVAPAVAATDDRAAFAYRSRSELQLAILDEKAQRLGDVLTIAPTPRAAAPAVAFAGATATVFWTDDQGLKTRLMVATFTPGEAAVTAPRVAVDDPLTRAPPVTARLPSGAWAVAWLASSGGLSTLRVSPIGPGGALTGPTDVAKSSRFELLGATSGDDAVHFSWREVDASGATIAKVVRVTCAERRP